MAEENTGEDIIQTDVNTAPSAGDDVNVDAAGQQAGENIDAAGQSDAEKGQVKALQTIREEKRALQQQLNQMQQENYQMRQYLNQQKQPQEEQPYDDDDPVTFREMKELLKQEREQMRAETTQEQFQRNMFELQSKPDFNEAFKAVGEIIGNRPSFVKKLENDPDAPFILYELGKKIISSKNPQKGVLSQIQQNIERSKTLTDTGGMSTPDLNKANHVFNQSKEDFEKDWAKIKSGKVKFFS